MDCLGVELDSFREAITLSVRGHIELSDLSIRLWAIADANDSHIRFRKILSLPPFPFLSYLRFCETF